MTTNNTNNTNTTTTTTTNVLVVEDAIEYVNKFGGDISANWRESDVIELCREGKEIAQARYDSMSYSWIVIQRRFVAKRLCWEWAWSDIAQHPQTILDKIRSAGL